MGLFPWVSRPVPGQKSRRKGAKRGGATTKDSLNHRGTEDTETVFAECLALLISVPSVTLW